MIGQVAAALDWLWRSLRPDLVAEIGFALAATVTVHVLLRKRDVSAAIAWIGLSWLVPVVGPALYYLFGISRVTRRAREVRTRKKPGAGVASPRPSYLPRSLEPLDRAVGIITGQGLVAGNAVAVLRSGDEAYPAMLDAIAGATTSVALSTYILQADGTGDRFVAALADARARGVAVRVLVDGVGSGWFLPGAYGRLRRRGVPVARFMHSLLPWRMPFVNLRSHKKLLLVDGRSAFLGGLNIGDENLLAQRPPSPVRDTHFRIDGPVSAQLMADFARDWAFATGEELDGPAWAARAAESGEAGARAVPSGPDQDIETIEFVALQACAAARRSVRLMTPYFLPDDGLVTALALAAMRGIRVDILIPARSNHRFVDWATRGQVGPLLDRGVKVWLVPEPFDHSKLMVVDEAWSLVGSANMDMRSLRLNFELNLEVYDPDLARHLSAFMDGLRGKALTGAALAARSLPVRLRDAAFRLALPYL